MESSTAVPVHERATGSTTIADLIGLAAERHGDSPAIRHKRDGAWQRRQLRRAGRDRVGGRPRADRPRHRAGRPRRDPLHDPAGVDLRGLRHHDHRRRRRPDLPDELARGVRVGRGQLRVARDRLRGRRAGREDPRGPRRPAGARDDHRRSTRRATSATRSRSTTLRERGRGARRRRARRAHRARSRASSRTRSSTRPARPARRRAACSATATTATSSRCASSDAVVQAGDVAYLFLPLAHSFALLIQLAALDMGATLAYFGGDPKQIIAELSEVRPTYLPSVPRIFEKLYTLVTAHGDAEQIKAATQVGLKVRALQAAGPGGAARAAGALRRRRGEAVQERPRGVRRAACARRRPARRRSRRRSSSSSSPAACRCSRATG